MKSSKLECFLYHKRHTYIQIRPVTIVPNVGHAAISLFGNKPNNIVITKTTTAAHLAEWFIGGKTNKILRFGLSQAKAMNVAMQNPPQP